MSDVRVAIFITSAVVMVVTLVEHFGPDALFVVVGVTYLFLTIRRGFMQTVITPNKEILMEDVTEIACPKCQHTDGGDWSQCGGECPLEVSPHYSHKKYDLQEDIRNLHRLASMWFNNSEILMLERVLRRVKP